jgi:hypothetical protein
VAACSDCTQPPTRVCMHACQCSRRRRLALGLTSAGHDAPAGSRRSSPGALAVCVDGASSTAPSVTREEDTRRTCEERPRQAWGNRTRSEHSRDRQARMLLTQTQGDERSNCIATRITKFRSRYTLNDVMELLTARNRASKTKKRIYRPIFGNSCYFILIKQIHKI